MPYGCGEQNLLNFAPNIFIMKYLQHSNQLTSEIEAKLVDYTISGRNFIIFILPMIFNTCLIDVIICIGLRSTFDILLNTCINKTKVKGVVFCRLL